MGEPVGNFFPSSGHREVNVSLTVIGNSDETMWGSDLSNEMKLADLFERHIDALTNHCFRCCGNWATAEDSAAGVFTILVHDARKLRFYEGSARPWLLTTGSNLIRNEQRRLRRFQRVLLAVGRPYVSEDHAPTVLDRVSDEQRAREALALLSELPDRERDVFLLCDYAELSYEQIAWALDVPTGTVRSRLFRARARLARRLDKGVPPAADSATG